jgi:hypothetical protein
MAAEPANLGVSPERSCCRAVPLPDHWSWFESMDHGAASPTAWLAFAVDEDGNCVAVDEHYAVLSASTRLR